jgi:hypothetical protein
MRRLVPVAIAFVLVVGGLLACEQRFSSEPPPVTPGSPTASPSAIDALLAARIADAGTATGDAPHAMTVTLCSVSPHQCPPPDPGASGEATYRVLFGSGLASVRSRGQAMADLYKELRDRTAVGERLDAESHAPGRAVPLAKPDHAPTTEASEGNSDPVTRCAFHLLDLVDGVGEVTLDVVHESGLANCTVSLGGASATHGAAQCLISAPDRPKGRPTGGLNF